MDNQLHWAQVYRQEPEKPKYDLWLDGYEEVLEASRGIPIVDLGCGRGNDSLYLAERGYQVIACDYSDAALQQVRTHIPEALTMRLNLLEGLPFADHSALVVLADLCLHYFLWADTECMVREIWRVLQPGGTLLCRVNSVRDVHYGAGQGELVEENYYLADGQHKRFFDRPDIDRLFRDWQLCQVKEYQMDRYGRPKRLWEVAVEKPVGG